MDAGETAENRHTVTWYDVMIWYMSAEVFHESATLCIRIGGDSEVGSWNVSGSNQLNE